MKTLPDNPSLDHLRRQAKDLLAGLRDSAPAATLAEAQASLAGQYGFRTWADLKAEVDRRRGRADVADPGLARRIAERFALGAVAGEMRSVSRPDEMGRRWVLETERGRWAPRTVDDVYPVTDGEDNAQFQEAAARAGVVVPAPVRSAAGAVVEEIDGHRWRVYAQVASGPPLAAPAGAATLVRPTVTGTQVRVAVNVRFSGVVTVPVTVSDGTGTATTALRITVRPAAVVAATGRIVANPEVRGRLATPSYVDGRPTSRTLSTRVDSQLTWRVSPTTSVVGYRVDLNGVRVCTVAAVPGAALQSCRVDGAAVTPGDILRVTAVGAGGTLSVSTGASITPAAATNRLLAVVYFPSGEFVLDATARRVLADVARQARTYGFTTARMVGHTDSDSSASFNERLSRQRADQVADYFRRAYPGLRATHTGHGEALPALPNTTDRNKAANRRVEIYVG
ncbi:OmpA family protein [Spirilliplanes yamanashiensis]|uniref:OmpA-like domain-containing protein n=1 Tax=Spirilliplanes yamanashiensis TaxID=42233 RepID=A0A8J3Y7M5_9ACTN|nr:OmpA family protein [Spirilliplanes yamanashiensis]MDP9815145.1 outer membrane protein OmpA-like peptidoglycan-associated protein [Spirilliplanes yamanashiensis]GIJ02800.1 hypothetical protein Sya03_21520 [Spirilliplanes yamanashiensis]